MKLVVFGLWHLGCVTAACCAKHVEVVGLDPDASLVANLSSGRPPISEPGLDDLIAAGLASKQLRFTTDAASACAGAQLLWVTFDTPVGDDDTSDVEAVLAPLRKVLPHLAPGTVVLISSQLPVGTCAKLEGEFPALDFAVSPENLRLGQAIAGFEKADRIVIGLRHERNRALLESLLGRFTQRLIWMRPESAEMVKHALNGFLALSISFINEIAIVCEAFGADAKEVSTGLKSDPRVGERAFVNPGGPFAGGTLARDVVSLSRISQERGLGLELVPAIKRSNDHHRSWAVKRLQETLGELSGKRIAILGLTYKPGTDTLRRSLALEVAAKLIAAGATCIAYDPAVRDASHACTGLLAAASLEEALAGADAAVVSTEWPVFREANWPALLSTMRRPLVLDANGFLRNAVAGISGARYHSVGQST